MDYGTLAQLSNPGQNPIAGPGIVDIQAYRNYQNLATMREQALQKAIPLADMSAQQEAQKNKEYMMGSQGREDMVNLSNLKAKNAPAEYTRDTLTKDLEHALKDADLRKKLTDATEDIGGDGDAYINGDEKTKQAVLAQLKGRKLRNGYVMGTDPVKDDQVLTVAGEVRRNKPEVKIKEVVQDKKNEGAYDVADLKGRWAQDTAANRDKTMLEIAKLKQATEAARAANRPLSAEQQMFESIKRIAKGDDSIIYALMSQYKSAQAQAKMENEAAFLKEYNIKGPKQAPTHAPIIPGVVSGASSTATAQPDKPKFEVGKVYTDKNGVKAKFTEKGWEIVKEGT